MLTAVIGALAVLAGGITTGAFQHLTTNRSTRDTRRAEHLAALVAAVVEYLQGLLLYRQEQWLKHATARDGLPDTHDARRARYEARTRMTGGLDRLYMLTTNPVLLAAARAARDAAIAVGDLPTTANATEREAARDESRRTHTALRNAAAHAIHTHT
ncbi:hypothetical protein [Streptomyces sp. NPDC049881]|uniref:hypothetical protein n=1 Tax=unclassified Streptomyces TaxID=2593676 RepID=UPI0034139B2C